MCQASLLLFVLISDILILIRNYVWGSFFAACHNAFVDSSGKKKQDCVSVKFNCCSWMLAHNHQLPLIYKTARATIQDRQDKRFYCEQKLCVYWTYAFFLCFGGVGGGGGCFACLFVLLIIIMIISIMSYLFRAFFGEHDQSCPWKNIRAETVMHTKWKNNSISQNQ